MIKNRKLSKAIFNMAWSDLISKIDTYYTSSKICSRCGSIKENLLIEERIFSCFECNFEKDRNINAFINILNKG